MILPYQQPLPGRRISEPKHSSRRLFVPQCDQWVDASGAKRGNEAGGEGNDSQHAGDNYVGERILGADNDETPDETTGGECEGCSNYQANRNDEKSVAKNH